MQYPDSVEFLYALGNELKTVKFGLERIRRLLQGLGDPQRAFRIVHVAGTNGKGSTCAMMASGLQAAGFRTGLFTSPHLIEPTERIRIQGADIAQPDFVRVFERVHQCAEEMVARGELDMHPTYFETITAMGFVAFAEAGVDWAVVEVGLGGRLDATNVVEPAICAITPIDFDHEAWLGNSIESIAAEKAGILKCNVPAVFAKQHPQALAVLRDRAHTVGAPALDTADWSMNGLELSADGCRFSLTRERTLRIACPLRGAWQVENARTAAAVLDLLQIPAPAIQQGIQDVRWAGRLELVSRYPEIYIDGAHNPSGCAALAEFIRSSKGNHRTWLVFGAMRDKAISEMTSLLFPWADEIILTAPQQPRALRPEALAEEFSLPPNHTASSDRSPIPRLHLAPSLPAAMEILRDAAPEDRIFIAGSLYLAGEAKAWFQTHRSTSASGPSPVK